jgi:D-threo-aldose 1-dehydrogenase|tara:strand:- start:186 stop:347 length:162 start_codon:yes stop_codon:yes gene_type:complete
VPIASAALQFPLAHPAVVNVIPGISSASRVESTVEQVQRKIPVEFWLTLKEEA